MQTSSDKFISTRGLVRKSLKASFWEGACAALVQGVIDNYMVPYALAFGAAARQISWLAALPPLAGAMVQWFAGHLTRLWRGRKIVYRRAVAVQVSVLWALAAVPWLPAARHVAMLVVLAVVLQIFGGLTGPVWHSLLSQYVPASKRTGYFGWRGRWFGMFVIVFGFVAGGILRFSHGKVLIGFSALFFLAGAARLLSWFFIGRMYEPPRAHRTGRFTDFRAESRGSSFGAFILFTFGVAFFTNLTAPYFSVYMLKNLGYSYWTYSLLVTTAGFTGSVMMAVWGKQADRVGTTRIFKFCACLTPLLPWAWILSTEPRHVFFFQILSGTVWSGYNVCAMNYLFEVVPSGWRTQAVAYFNVANGVAICGGAWIGGRLLEHVPAAFGYSFYTMLLTSGAGRLLMCVFFLKAIQPPRLHPEVTNWNILSHAVGLEKIKGRRWKKAP